jgi:hypothetical protein
MNQQLLAKTFVELADNLVADFDLIDFLRLLTDRCVGMLGASAAGVLLADRDGELRVMAASDEQVRLLELFQLQNDEGPCLEAFRTGAQVIVPDLTREIDRWPRFATAAHRSGFGAVQALPMRLREETVGALNLFRAAPGPVEPAGTLIAQALADVATISHAGISFWLASGVDPAECARRAGQSIQVLFQYYAKFLAGTRDRANQLIEDSMNRWEESPASDEAELSVSWPGNTPDQLVSDGTAVGQSGSKEAFRLAV